MEQIEQEFAVNIHSSITACIEALGDNCPLDVTITRIESSISAIHYVIENDVFSSSWLSNVLTHLENTVNFLNNISNWQPRPQRGRPTVHINLDKMEHLLSMNFSVPDISKILKVSRATIFRRMAEQGITVRQTYSVITEEELQERVIQRLQTHPYTGYKMMKGYLIQAGIKVTEYRVREVMRLVDPVGVYQRTQTNRAIRRRQYYVPYFNSMWHIDGNHKLIRWGIVVRAGIDGKTRIATYISAGTNNRADTHLGEFLDGVEKYGVPIRCRSDKGKENVLIAKFMIENRGVGRASHICGRSVHNQRIERFWGNVFYNCLSTFYNLFLQMEYDCVLDIDNPKHICILHKVFLPRLNDALKVFIEGWNNHPMSTEGNKTPRQLRELYPPPADSYLDGPRPMLFDDMFLQNIDDIRYLDGEDSITNPITDSCLSDHEIDIISNIDILRNSDSFGYDIFIDALADINDIE